MTIRSRTQKALSILLPAGVLGVSAALASAHALPSTADQSAASLDPLPSGVAARLQAIRSNMPSLDGRTSVDPNADPNVVAWWGNWGGGGLAWRNGGWGNGGWRNGGWGNGGWHNWGNGWHNWGNGGWHNFWHNW